MLFLMVLSCFYKILSSLFNFSMSLLNKTKKSAFIDLNVYHFFKNHLNRFFIALLNQKI